MTLDRWLLGAAFTIIMFLAGSWGTSVHSQLSDIKVAVTTIATTQSGFATEVALIKMRLERLERMR
jgi:hypothetical protein